MRAHPPTSQTMTLHTLTHLCPPCALEQRCPEISHCLRHLEGEARDTMIHN